MFIFLAIGVLLLTGAAVSTYLIQRNQPVDELYADDTASLSRALNRAADGGVIELTGSTYSALVLADHQWPTQGVTLFVTPGKHVMFESIELRNVEGLHVTGVEVAGAYRASSSRALELSHTKVGDGLHLRDGTNDVKVYENTFSGGGVGISIGSDGDAVNQDIAISHNVISDHRGDNVHIEKATRVLIEDNEIQNTVDNVDENSGVEVTTGSEITIRRNRLTAQDRAITLAGRREPGNSTISRIRIENNLFREARDAGIFVAGTTSVDIVNNTGADNTDADIHIEGTNPELKVWNNAVMSILAKDPQTPGFSFNNCTERHSQPGPTDVLTTPQYVGSEYRLLANTACAKAATTVRAPTDDLDRAARSNDPSTGALQPKA